MWMQIINLLIFLILTICPVYIGYRLSFKIFKDTSVPIRWISTTLLALSVVILIFLTSAIFCVFNKYIVSLLCLFMAVAAYLILRGDQHSGSEVRAILDFISWMRKEHIWPFVLIVLLIFFFTFFRGLLMPPLAWDSLTYHLVLPATWIQNSGIVEFSAPHGMDGYTHFPINFHILLAWVMLPWHSDLFANGVNFFVLLMGVLILFSLGREFLLSRKLSLLLPVFFLFSPFVFVYVTTAYTDIFVCILLLGCLLFLLRFLRSFAFGDAFFFFLAMALAVGTKQSAFYLAALMGVVFVLALIKKYFNSKQSSLFAIIPVGFLLLLTIGGFQYFRNWATVGNPLYPYEVSFAGETVFKGSEYVKKITEEKGIGNFRDDLENLKILFSYNQRDYPRTAGPKYIIIAVLSLGILVYSLFWERDTRLLLLGLFALVPFLFFYLDTSLNTVLARRFWPYDTPRFLAPSFAILSIMAFALLAKWEKRMPRIGLYVFLFFVADIFFMNFSLLRPFQNAVFIFLAITSTGFLALMFLKSFRYPRRFPYILAILTFFLFAFGMVTYLHNYREKTRSEYYLNYIDLHQFPRVYLDGWNWCDLPDSPSTIALMTGWNSSGHNWFYYPLFGRRMQNRVVYVPIGEPGFYSSRINRGLRGEKPDFQIWLQNLRFMNVDLVFVQEPWSIELDWIRDYGQYFFLVSQGEFFSIYRFKDEDSQPYP